MARRRRLIKPGKRPLQAVNAWLTDDRSICAWMATPDGGRSRRHIKAQWVNFIRATDLTRDIRRALSASRSVLGFETEGDWVRVRWRDRSTRYHACKAGPEDKPRKHGWFQRQGIETFEGDVDPVQRWLADSDVQIARPRRCYLDIETDSRQPFSRKHKMRVLCWCVIDDDSGTGTSSTLREDSDESERDLLRKLFDHLEGFDQVMAWNGNGFDFPVIRARAKHCKLTIETDRWMWLDHMAWFKKANVMAAESGDEKQSMALHNIATALLGEGKDPFDASRTWEAWETKPCRDGSCAACRRCMKRYCVKDTDLLRRIEAETGYIELLHTLCETCRLFGSSRAAFPQARVDAFMLRLGRKQGIRFPTKQRFDETEKKQFRGAFVMKPTRLGILTDVHVADFKSLYPAIIMSWNMSPGTKVTKPEPTRAGIPASAAPTYLSHYPLVYPVRPEGVAEVPITGVWFDNSREGLLPHAVRTLVELREVWKQKKKAAVPGTPESVEADRRSTAYKIAANSFYGVMGQQAGRFFDVEVAESVAQAGVWLIKETIEHFEAAGGEVIYADSVTGDRVIVTKDSRGDVRLMPAGELWEESETIATDGPKQRGALPGWTALSTKDGEPGWFPIREIVRHKAAKATYRISTKHGQTQVTTDHGIMVDGIETAPIDFVREGASFTAVPPHRPRLIERIDLLKYVEGFAYRQSGTEKLRFLVGDGDRIVLDGRKSEVSFQRYFHKGTPQWASLLRLVAAYVCDGSATIRAGADGSKNALSFCKSDEDMMVELADDLADLLGGAKVFGPYWSDTVYVVRSSTALAACLFAAFCGKGCRNKKLPPFILDLDAADAATFVDRLAMGDGSIDPAGQFCFTSTSQQLAAGVSYLLAQHDRPHGFSFRESKGAWAIRTRKGKERPSRYSIKAERFEPDPDEWVYDLSVEGAHTFVDGIGRVLLHNTDGAYVVGITRDRMAALVDECNRDLYPRMLKEQQVMTNRIVLDFEKSFDRMILLAKKRYAARFSFYGETAATETSKPEIKGLEFMRGDTIKLCRTMQKEVIERLLGDDDGWDAAAIYVEITERWLHALLTEPLELADVKLSKTVKALSSYKRRTKKDGTAAKLLPHVEIAMALKKKGGDVTEGTKIDYFCVDASGKDRIYKHADEWQGECDRHELWEAMVWPATRRVLEAAFPAEDWDRYAWTRPIKQRTTPAKGRGRQLAQQITSGQGSLFD